MFTVYFISLLVTLLICVIIYIKLTITSREELNTFLLILIALGLWFYVGYEIYHIEKAKSEVRKGIEKAKSEVRKGIEEFQDAFESIPESYRY